MAVDQSGQNFINPLLRIAKSIGNRTWIWKHDRNVIARASRPAYMERYV